MRWRDKVSNKKWEGGEAKIEKGAENRRDGGGGGLIQGVE